ncbi:MAG: peptidase [Cytophagales bacterium]|nr:peptidase [Cytophagales bacterium]
MKSIVGSFIALFLCTVLVAQDLPTVTYEIDATQNLDTFAVSLSLDGKLDKSATIFQFASTAPGTYQTMNIGRYVSDFKAFDAKGKELTVTKQSVNQFVISKPQKLTRVTYLIAETFDTQVDEYPIYLMCGSSIENDHTLINAHTVMGYFEGNQKSPIRMRAIGLDGWNEGTALSKVDDYYIADDFDHAVDSPILMGNLTGASTDVAGTKVEIYTYSANDKYESKILLDNMADMLEATRKFLITLPVDRYTFLYFFEPTPPGVTGAWEHSYSSEYVLAEDDPTPDKLRGITDIASHEFFHIVTPLNIHSEVVESFNFVKPTTSVHLWLYEGVTEWASNIILFRGGVIDEDDYLTNAVVQKILVDERYFDTSWSLKKISDESFNGGEAAKQYGNIYYRGSLVAGLLDIKLLELSDGESGLRELMLALVKKYGKGNPISEDTFFDDLADMTSPEIRPFFDKYILEVNPLPHEEYLAKIGLKLEREESGRISITKMEEMTDQQQKLYDAWSMRL